jgi:hypothetical protein
MQRLEKFKVLTDRLSLVISGKTFAKTALGIAKVRRKAPPSRNCGRETQQQQQQHRQSHLSSSSPWSSLLPPLWDALSVVSPSQPSKPARTTTRVPAQAPWVVTPSMVVTVSTGTRSAPTKFPTSPTFTYVLPPLSLLGHHLTPSIVEAFRRPEHRQAHKEPRIRCLGHWKNVPRSMEDPGRRHLSILCFFNLPFFCYICQALSRYPWTASFVFLYITLFFSLWNHTKSRHFFPVSNE